MLHFSDDREQILLLRQFRKARDEMVRAMLMLRAVTDEDDEEKVEELEEMAALLTAHMDGIVKAKDVDDDEDEDEDDEE
jgi:CHASE3 domain sensor protein